MSPAAQPGAKATATVALVNLDPKASVLLRDCFRQFGIETAAMSAEETQRLRKEKFQGLVLPLDDTAEPVLQTCRQSPSNSRIVVYGIAGSLQEALYYSRYGINAVLDRPLERQSVLRAVRSTHLLVLHELRRYVRIPIVTKVSVQRAAQKLTVTSEEISAGGLSAHTETKFTVPTEVELAFDLPEFPAIVVRAAVCWMRESDGMAGLRFAADDERRLRVKEWIDNYLDL